MDRNAIDILEQFFPAVALRKESVDRNFFQMIENALQLRSLSARRAWIEIWKGIIKMEDDKRRSPQGERG